MIISIISLAVRLVLLGILTFLFVVLYEHGPENYLENVRKDALALLQTATSQARVASPQ